MRLDMIKIIFFDIDGTLIDINISFLRTSGRN